MVARVQEARIGTNNTPPADGSLLPGQFYLEMGTPTRLWVGVPTSIVASGAKLLMDVDAQTAANASYVPKAGATMTGPLVLSGEPAAALGAATKQTVDLKAPIASPVFTGTPSLPTGTVAVTQAPGNNTNAPATTAFVAAAAAPALNNAGRNLIHNPLFNVAQRGGGPFSTASAYTLDRWQMNFTGGTYQVSQQPVSDAFRAQIGDEAARSYLSSNFAGGGAAGDFAQLVQAVEDVRRLAGKTITVSFWAIASANGVKCGVGLYQSFGTGGAPSPGVFAPATPVTLTNAWARYSVTLTVPSATGKTLGTALNDFTMLVLWASSGSTNNANAGAIGVQTAGISFWGVQLEIGSVMTPLEKLDPQQDVAKCQRYYSTGVVDFNGYGATGGVASTFNTFPVQMRAAPTVVYGAAPAYGNASGITAVPYAGGMKSYVIVTATGSVSCTVNYTASADL